MGPGVILYGTKDNMTYCNTCIPCGRCGHPPPNANCPMIPVENGDYRHNTCMTCANCQIPTGEMSGIRYDAKSGKVLCIDCRRCECHRGCDLMVCIASADTGGTGGIYAGRCIALIHRKCSECGKNAHHAKEPLAERPKLICGICGKCLHGDVSLAVQCGLPETDSTTLVHPDCLCCAICEKKAVFPDAMVVVRSGKGVAHRECLTCAECSRQIGFAEIDYDDSYTGRTQGVEHHWRHRKVCRGIVQTTVSVTPEREDLRQSASSDQPEKEPGLQSDADHDRKRKREEDHPPASVPQQIRLVREEQPRHTSLPPQSKFGVIHGGDRKDDHQNIRSPHLSNSNNSDHYRTRNPTHRNNNSQPRGRGGRGRGRGTYPRHGSGGNRGSYSGNDRNQGEWYSQSSGYQRY